MPDKPYVFISYARADFEPVQKVVEELRALGIDTWTDAQNLTPGENWVAAIDKAIRQTQALVVFVSPASAQQSWVMHEVEAAREQGIRTIPILLRATPASALHLRLATIQWLDMSRSPLAKAAADVAAEIARRLPPIKSVPQASQLSDQQRQKLATALAAQVHGQVEAPMQKNENPPTTIFIVHGHDEEFLRDVENFLFELGITPIIMKDVGGALASLLQKFFEVSTKADFAIILLSGDDMGAARVQYEMPDVGLHALKYRTRQNVMLELGFFYGRLGWENVFVLEREPPKPYPDFERPSDLSGVVWDRYDKAGRWRMELHRRLVEAKFKISGQAAKKAT